MANLTLAIDLLREWDSHNRRHSCYYESEEYYGTNECPSFYKTLGDFLGASGFPVENTDGQIFGRSFTEPNFRSRISGTEKPVSISERRKRGTLQATEAPYKTEGTRVLEKRAESARTGAEDNQEQPWQVDAMDYFKGRLDEIQESMTRALSAIMAEQEKQRYLLNEVNSRVAKVLDERSESGVAVTPSVTITLENVPSEVAEELQAELDTRLQRILTRNAAVARSKARDKS